MSAHKNERWNEGEAFKLFPICAIIHPLIFNFGEYKHITLYYCSHKKRAAECP